MSKHIPLFSCGGCMEDHSWPAEDLRVHKESLWCESCWDHCGDMSPWGQLEGFIHQRKQLTALLEEKKRLREVVDAAKAWRIVYDNSGCTVLQIHALVSALDTLKETENV